MVQKVPHNKFFVEYGLKNLVSVSLDGLLYGLWKYRNKNKEDGREEKLYSRAYMRTVKFFSCVLFLSFFRPLLLGDSYILYRPFSIIWALHLLIIQTLTWAPVPSDTLINSLWVAVAKVALFRGLLLINATRRVVVMHLMWWWQPLMRYFRLPSFLRVWRMDYSGWDAPLIQILQCPRRNYSLDTFSLPQWA